MNELALVFPQHTLTQLETALRANRMDLQAAVEQLLQQEPAGITDQARRPQLQQASR